MTKKIYYTISILIVILMVHCIQYAHANQEQSAEEYLTDNINKIMGILQTPEWRTERGQKKLYPEVRAVTRGMFDFDAVSAQIVGPKWQQFSEEQRAEFSAAFGDLLEYSYADSFRNYNGQTVSIAGTRKNASGTQVEVTVNLVGTNNKITPMVYRLRKIGDSWKVYNVIVENINLIVSYKTQLETILANNPPSVAIEKLRMQAKQLQNKKHSNTPT